MNKSGTFCGCFSGCWCSGVHRIAPKKAGKGKVLRTCIWIVLREFVKCRNQADHRVSDRCIDGPSNSSFVSALVLLTAIVTFSSMVS